MNVILTWTFNVVDEIHRTVIYLISFDYIRFVDAVHLPSQTDVPRTNISSPELCYLTDTCDKTIIIIIFNTRNINTMTDAQIRFGKPNFDFYCAVNNLPAVLRTFPTTFRRWCEWNVWCFYDCAPPSLDCSCLWRIDSFS